MTDIDDNTANEAIDTEANGIANTEGDNTDTDTDTDGAEGQDSDTDGAEGEALEAADTSTGAGRDIVPPKYRAIYRELGGNCGDFIAAELSALIESGGLDSLNSVKAENNIPAGKWTGLNNGQQRMNLSNTLRATYLRGETITIVGKQYNIHTAKEEYGDFDVTVEAQADDFLRMISMPATDRNRAALVRIFKTLPEKAVATAKRLEEAEAKKAENAKKKAEAQAKKDEAKLKAEAEKVDGDAPAAVEKKPRRAKKADAVAEEAAAA